MNNSKKYITIPNVIIFLFMIYFVVLNERKMIIESGPDPAIIEFQKYMIKTNAKIESMKRADSIHLQNIVDYAKKIIENNDVVDHYDHDQLDSAFAALTRDE